MANQQKDEKRDRFFEEMAEDFARLRADREASADYDAELAGWDIALLDGLDEWPYVEGVCRARLYDGSDKDISAD